MIHLATSPTVRRYLTGALLLGTVSALALALAAGPPPIAEPEIICVEPSAPQVEPTPTVEIESILEPGIVAYPAVEGMPAPCIQYGGAIDALARCEGLPAESRKALRDGWAAAKQAWTNVPAEAYPALADACVQGRDAIRQAATQLCPNVPQY